MNGTRTSDTIVHILKGGYLNSEIRFVIRGGATKEVNIRHWNDRAGTAGYETCFHITPEGMGPLTIDADKWYSPEIGRAVWKALVDAPTDGRAKPWQCWRAEQEVAAE